MHFRIWDTKPVIFDQFVQEAKELGSIDLYENPHDLEEDREEGDYLVFEYSNIAKQTKLLDKILKKINKSDRANTIIFIYEQAFSKDIIKHQKSKNPADYYISLPVSLGLLSSLLGVELDIELPAVTEEETTLSREDLTIPSLPPIPGQMKEQTSNAISIPTDGTIEFNMKKDNLESEMSSKNQDKDNLEELDGEVFEELPIEETGLSFGQTDSLLSSDEDDFDLGLEDETEQTQELSLSSDEQSSEDFLLTDNDSEDDSESDFSLSDDADDSLDSNDLGGQELNLEMTADIGLNIESSDELSFSTDNEEGSDDESLDFGDSLNDDLPEALEENSPEASSLGDLSLSFATEDIDSELEEDQLFDNDSLKDDSSLELSDSEPFEVAQNSTTEQGFDFSDEENALDLSDDFSFADENDSETEAGIEMSDSLDLDEGLEFSEENDLSATDLPASPMSNDEFQFDNDTTQRASEDLTGDLSADALAKLAEIDQMLQEDATSNAIRLKPLDQNDEFSDEDYDPTADEGASFEAALDFEEDVPLDDAQSVEVKTQAIVNTPAATQAIAHHQDTAKNDIYNEELLRLSETISLLRNDRDELLLRVTEFERKEENKNDNEVSYRAQIDEKNIEITVLKKRYENRLSLLEKDAHVLAEKNDLYHEKLKRLELENDKLKKENNYDLMRIKHREKELENQLELLKADTSAQISNRDQKILQLKRRIDTLEFDLEAIQTREKRISDDQFAIEDRMEKVINTLRNAIGDLEDETSIVSKPYNGTKKNIDI